MEGILKTYGATRTQMSKTVNRLELLVTKFKTSGIDQLNVSDLTAQLMTIVQQMELKGREKKELVLSLTTHILNEVGVVKEIVKDELLRIQTIVPVLIDNFAILLKQQKRKFKDCCFGC